MIHHDQHRLPFLFASILTGYPDKDFPKNAEGILNLDNNEADCNPFKVESFAAITKKLGHIIATKDGVKDLASDYIDIFDRAQPANSPYESDYSQNQAMSKGTELADLAGFYKAFGLDFTSPDTTHDMLDHVSRELEFYAYLLAKQEYLNDAKDEKGSSIVYDARKSFLKDHLGTFVSPLAKQPLVAAHHFYSKVFIWCDELVRAECKNLGVKPIIAVHFGKEAPLPDAMTCGTVKDSVLPVL